MGTDAHGYLTGANEVNGDSPFFNAPGEAVGSETRITPIESALMREIRGYG